ncbi:MAG: VOC family protein [Acidimicrobiales bacterium]
MPAFSRVSHISFSSRDAERSATWLAEVLGFTELERVEGPGWRGILLIHGPTATVIEFQQHDDNQGEEFDPRRTGFDHMGFRVDERAGLDEWMDHLHALDVTHSPIAEREYGSVLPFKDPDGIQFEILYREDRP